MSTSDGLLVIEPIEQYLRTICCVDRLAIYQDGINLLKRTLQQSKVESLNSIINNVTYESPSEVLDEVHRYLEQYIIEGLSAFEVNAKEGDLAFLTKLLELMNLLDAVDEHETICNLIQDQDPPLESLYLILNYLANIDEEQFYQSVTMCSMGLIQRIYEIHKTAFDKLTEQQTTEVAVDLTDLKTVISNNRNFIITQMFEDCVVSTSMSATPITLLAKDYFNKLSEKTTPKQLAQELIGVYLLTGLKPPELTETIKGQVHHLWGNDATIATTLTMLGSTYLELTNG